MSTKIHIPRRSARYDKDCPKCKYGTLVPWFDQNRVVIGERCIDCGHRIATPAKRPETRT